MHVNVNAYDHRLAFTAANFNLRVEIFLELKVKSSLLVKMSP